MDYLDERMRTAYFPGEDLYGEDWLQSAKKDASVKLIIIERHHDSTKALRIQELLGKKQLVIAMNNELRARAGCPKCPYGWHQKIEEE